MHFLCMCMLFVFTHVCVIWVGGLGSVMVCMQHFRDNTLRSLWGCGDACMWCPHVCVPAHVCLLVLSIYFDPSKSMFEAATEIQASNRLSCRWWKRRGARQWTGRGWCYSRKEERKKRGGYIWEKITAWPWIAREKRITEERVMAYRRCRGGNEKSVSGPFRL